MNNLKPLKKNFFIKDAIYVAKSLLNKILVVKNNNKYVGGVICETEAYLPTNDPACHAARGITKRNKVMYAEGGTIYVYFTYGNYYMLNIVAEKKEIPAAVLIRSLEPKFGIDIMQKNRKKNDIAQLTNGPGKICQALNINLKYNNTLLGEKIFIFANLKNLLPKNIITTTRIGINVGADLPLRFYIKDCKFVSRK